MQNASTFHELKKYKFSMHCIDMKSQISFSFTWFLTKITLEHDSENEILKDFDFDRVKLRCLEAETYWKKIRQIEYKKLFTFIRFQCLWVI